MHHGGKKNFRRESSEETKNFQLKRSGDGVFDLIFEERVGHVQAVTGDRDFTFTEYFSSTWRRKAFYTHGNQFMVVKLQAVFTIL